MVMMKRLRISVLSVLLALGFLGLGEGILRLVGWGAPSEDPYMDISGDVSVYERVGDWLETRADKKRLFRYERFEAQKPARTRRIICLGGSDVFGYPYTQAGAWPALLQKGLNENSPSWQVINSGGIAYASYRVLRVFREVIAYEPDAIVVMTGHNEFLEKRVYAEPLAVNPTLRALRTALGRLYLFNVLRHALIRKPDPQKALLGENVSWDYVPRDDKQKKLTEEHFAFSLREMARLGRAGGIPVIFVTAPCNLKDYPPLGGDGSDAAHAAYARGRELTEAGNYKEAYLAFRKAADLDDHPVRAFSSYNDIIRKIAGFKGCFLADAEAAFIKASVGIPGDDLFLDHVHFRSEGAAIVAYEVAAALVSAGLMPQQRLSAVTSGIASARKSLSPEQEAFARYGAAYEAFHYMNQSERPRKLLLEALKIFPVFPEASQLLDEIPRSDQTPENNNGAGD